MHNNFYGAVCKLPLKLRLLFFGVLLICFGTTLPVLAQFDQRNISYSPSPNSSSLAKYAASEVNLYTGVPAINAELHVLNGRSLNIPINLNYNASGVKVQEIASNVGLGWTISTNSMITRVVNGLPDEDLSSGYFGSDMGQKITGVLSSADMEAISNNDKDSEPDLFYYNLNGITGKLVFDKDKNPLVLENNGVRVLNSPFKKELQLDGWLLIDGNGNKYYLGNSVSSKETTNTTAYFKDSNKTMSFDSTWYLEKIEAFNLTETIYFNYISGDPITVTHYSKKMKMRNKVTSTYYKEVRRFWIRVQKASSSVDIEVIDQEAWDSNVVEAVSSPKYLSTIMSDNESVSFHYKATGRTDLTNGKALEQIDIKDYTGQVMSSFRLVQHYQQSVVADPASVPEQDRHRLMLDEVTLINNANVSKPLYRFKYNTTSLPARNTSEVDSWGYYNSNVHGFFPSEDLEEIAKNVDPERMKASTLEEFIYASGGYKHFEFEPNRYYDYQTHSAHLAGGLRVKKVVDVPGLDQQPKVSKYSYQQQGYDGKRLRPDPVHQTMVDHNQSMIPYKLGVIMPNNSGIPLLDNAKNPHAFVDPIGNISSPSYSPSVPSIPFAGVASFVGSLIGRFVAELQPTTIVRYSPFVISSSTPYNTLYDLEGATVGYSQVTVEDSEGKTVYSFTDIDQFPDMATQVRVDANFKTKAILYSDIAPFAPLTSYAQARGRIKSISYFDDKNNIVKSIFNQYTFSGVNQKVMGLRCGVGAIDVTGQQITNTYYNVGSFHYITFNLLSQETTEFNSAGVSKKTTSNYYASYPYLLENQTVENSDETVYSTHYKYAANRSQLTFASQSESDAALALENSGRQAVLLEQLTKKNNVIIGSNKVGFKTWQVNGKSLVMPEFVREGNGSIERVVRQNFEFDSFGHVLSEKLHNSPVTTTIWGHNGLYPIVNMVSAASNELFYENFENASGTLGNGQSGDRFHMGSFLVNFNKPNSREYVVSYWYRENNKWLFSGYLPYVGSMTISQGDALDNIVVAPKEAVYEMKIYHPSKGLIAASSDNFETKQFDYDGFQRLLTVKDKNKNILSHNVYQDVSTYVGPVFLNKALSQEFQKNNCSNSSEVGLKGVYTVPADRYYSYISQADADAKAQADIDSKGQNYVNETSLCAPHAPITFNGVIDPYFNGCNYTITKGFYDGKRVLCKVRARYDNLQGHSFEYIYDVQLEAHETEVSGYIQLGGGTTAEVELIEMILN